MKPVYFLLLLLLTSCKNISKTPSKITAKNIALDSTIIALEKIDDFISPYKKKLNNEMNKPLSFSKKNLTKKSTSLQSPLGNLMADMCYKISNPIFNKKTKKSIDFAMFNYGGLRATLPSGEINKGHAFKLMPFENELVVVRMSGNKIIELINYFIQNKKAHPLSNNILLTINKEKYTLKINNQKFDNNKSYNVLTSDYLQNGGDKMDFFKNPEKLTKLNYKVRDAIIDYFITKDTLRSYIDKRITIK